MIDTIKLSIDASNGSRVERPEMFRPEFKRRKTHELSDNELNEGHKKGYLGKYILRPRIYYGYTPRVTVFEKVNPLERKVFYLLQIEFSVPKMLFDNSLEEIQATDLNTLCTKIQTHLSYYGVHIKRDALLNARVTKAHFAKNIPLPKEMRMQELVAELSKMGSGKVYEGAKERFANDGTLARIRSGSQEDVFYEKIKDMQKPRTKAHDKQMMEKEKALIETYNLHGKEILRFEHRYTRVEPLKSVVNKLLKREYATPILFKELFDEAMWKTIIVDAWKAIYGRTENQTLFRCVENPHETILKHMLKEINNDAHSQNSFFTSFGIAMFMKVYGAEYMMSLCRDVWSERTCGERLQKKLDMAKKLTDKLPISDAISFIDMEIVNFKRFSLDSL